LLVTIKKTVVVQEKREGGTALVKGGLPTKKESSGSANEVPGVERA